MKVNDLQLRAMSLSQDALKLYPPIPDDVRGALTLGTYFEKDSTIFDLYLPGERPEDALVFVKVTMNNDTGEGRANVNDAAWRKLGLLP